MRLGQRVLSPQSETQKVPKEMVKTKPLTAVVQRHEEHRLPFQFFEDQLGSWFVGQVSDQVGAHFVQYRDAEQEVTAAVRLGLENLFAEVIGDQAVVAAELGDKIVCVEVESEGHAGQLKPGGPTLGAVDQSGHAVRSQGPASNPLEELCGVGIIESQVGLADLGEIAAYSVAAPGDGKIDPRR